MSFQFSKQEDKQVSEGYLEAIHAEFQISSVLQSDNHTF